MYLFSWTHRRTGNARAMDRKGWLPPSSAGMAGIKTILSVKLARQIQDKFEYLIWRSLRNALPFNQEVLAADQSLISRRKLIYRKSSMKESQLIKYVSRCLLVLDDVETILRNGDRIWRYGDTKVMGYSRWEKNSIKAAWW